MKGFHSNPTLKINTKLSNIKKQFISRPIPSILCDISRSTSLNTPKTPIKNQINKHYDNNNNNTNISISLTSPKHESHPSPQLLLDNDNENENNESILSSSSPKYTHYNYKEILLSNGYKYSSKIATTLQGKILKVKCIKENSKYFNKNLIIKITNRELHNNSITIIDNKKIKIYENIINEIRILKWLTRHHPPIYMTRYIDYFIDNKNIFLCMEDGGICFFKFVSQCHKLIDNNSLSIIEWQYAIKVLFKQMIIFINWLHNTMNTCHLDISLENLLISNVFIMTDYSKNNKQNQIYFSHNFEIRFCDFGLAEAFDGKDFRCDKYVGKTGYKAPKVYGKKEIFLAPAADVWSLGIVLFMISIGAPPFKSASKKEHGFNLIYNGQLYELLKGWNRMDYITPKMYDLLFRMLIKEEQRITINQILQHPWLQ